MFKSTGVVVVTALVALTLGGCTTTDQVVTGSTVVVASAQPFTSFNDHSTIGNTPANTTIAAATSAGFNYYDDKRQLVRDTSFGRYEIVSQKPFAVEYTIEPGVTWSDGVAVDGADLLLAWAANSGVLTTEGFQPAKYVDAGSGQFTDFPDDTVYFDGTDHSGLEQVTSVPTLGDDGRSITLEYDEYVADWQLAFKVGLPAHAVVESAMSVTGTDDESAAVKAKRLLVEAVQDGDSAILGPVSQAWNSAFNLVEGMDAPEMLVSSGPYTVTALTGDAVTLTANPRYSGERQPGFETVVVRTIADPLAAVAALRDGEVDVIAPSPTSDVLDALTDIDDVTVAVSGSGQFEHLDLQFDDSRNDVFGDPLVRRAFLKTVPRQAIVDELIDPLAEGATTRDSFLLAPGTPDYAGVVDDNGSSKFSRVDIAGAKRLLDDAGSPSPTVCILFDPANPRRVAEFRLIQASAATAGFTVTDCSKPDWEEFLGVDDVYDAALFAWTETTDAIASPAARLASGSSVSNFSHYSSAVVDQLLAEVAAETDASARRALLAQIDAELWSDAYGVPLYQFPSLIAVSDSVLNVSDSPLEPGVTWNLWHWRPAPVAA